MAAYSGALVRAAHFAFRPPVPGISPEHEKPVEKPDLFDPKPDQVAGQTGDVWQPDDPEVYTEMRDNRISHWAGLQQPVPSNVHSGEANIAATTRMLANHAEVLYRPEKYTPYKHASQGLHIQYVDGRPPQHAGESVPDNMSYLVAGKNSYDFTNQPNEVYSADNGGGRYRLGVRIEDWGLYEYHTKQGQEASLRAYTGLEPQFPVDKPAVQDPAPYTPNSSGTTTWTQPSWQDPSLFSLPSETAMTDFATANEAPATNSQFDDGGRL